MPDTAFLRYPFPAALAAEEAAWEQEIAADTRRELIRRAVVLLHQSGDCERHLMATTLAHEAADILRRLGMPDLADECSDPWGCDTAAAMRELERRQ
jgi:hypothetical protein